MVQRQVESREADEGLVQRSLQACAEGIPESFLVRVGVGVRARVRVLKRLWSGGRLGSSALLLGVALEPRRLYWVRVTSWEGATVRGRLAWAPSGEKRRPRGMEVWVREDEVHDFLLVWPQGRAEGGLLAKAVGRVTSGAERSPGEERRSSLRRGWSRASDQTRG